MKFKGIFEKEFEEAKEKAYEESSHNAYFGEGFTKGFDYAIKRTKAPEMLDMLSRIISLESIIGYPEFTKEEHKGEAVAVNNILNDIKLLVKQATEL